MRKLRFEEIINLSTETEPGNNRAGTWIQANRSGSEVVTAQLKISFLLTLKKTTITKQETKPKTSKKGILSLKNWLQVRQILLLFSSVLNGAWNNLLTAYFLYENFTLLK